MYISFAVPEPLVESKHFEDIVTRNRGLPHRETPTKDGSNSPNFFFGSQISDVDVTNIDTSLESTTIYY